MYILLKTNVDECMSIEEKFQTKPSVEEIYECINIYYLANTDVRELAKEIHNNDEAYANDGFCTYFILKHVE